MELLCERLFKKRKERGAIDFEFDEIYIELDNNKKVKNLKKRERRIGNRVIEEFMLLCNETVAEQFYWLELPFLYRIHENPSDEKIENFNQFVRNLGYIVKGQIHPKNFQMLLEDIKGKKKVLLFQHCCFVLCKKLNIQIIKIFILDYLVNIIVILLLQLEGIRIFKFIELLRILLIIE